MPKQKRHKKDSQDAKQKTHSGAKKRFKVTASGRLLRRHGMKSSLPREEVAEA